MRFGEARDGSILEEDGDDIVLFRYDPKDSEADVFRDVGPIRVVISRDALKAMDLASARTEPV